MLPPSRTSGGCSLRLLFLSLVSSCPKWKTTTHPSPPSCVSKELSTLGSESSRPLDAQGRCHLLQRHVPPLPPGILFSTRTSNHLQHQVTRMDEGGTPVQGHACGLSTHHRGGDISAEELRVSGPGVQKQLTATLGPHRCLINAGFVHRAPARGSPGPIGPGGPVCTRCPGFMMSNVVSEVCVCLILLLTKNPQGKRQQAPPRAHTSALGQCFDLCFGNWFSFEGCTRVVFLCLHFSMIDGMCHKNTLLERGHVILCYASV